VRLNPGISGLKNFRDPGIAIPRRPISYRDDDDDDDDDDDTNLNRHIYKQ